MSWFEKGQIVRSLAGHDKGKYHIVISSENEFAFIADGKGRTIDCPKKKKCKHLQKTNRVESLDGLTDKGIRGLLGQLNTNL